MGNVWCFSSFFLWRILLVGLVPIWYEPVCSSEVSAISQAVAGRRRARVPIHGLGELQPVELEEERALENASLRYYWPWLCFYL